MDPHPENMNRLGRAIAGLRHRKGWTQTELAERLGVSTNMVSDIENGNRKRVPKRHIIDQLEAVLQGDGELARLAGYTPPDDLPDDPTEAILAVATRLRDTVYAVRDTLYVVPTKQQLERVNDTDLVLLARHALAIVAERSDESLSILVQSIGEQLRALGARVG